MAGPLRDTEELQKQLLEFQELQRQLQFVVSQRQQIAMQLEEVKMAEAELGKSEKAVYRAIGSILIECTKADALSDLKEKRELFDMRASMLSKQEEKLKPKLDELRNRLEAALRENKVSK